MQVPAKIAVWFLEYGRFLIYEGFLFSSQVKGAVSASLHLNAGNLGQKTTDFNCFDFIHSFGVPSVSNIRKMVVSTTMESQRAYFVRNQRENVKITCNKTSD